MSENQDGGEEPSSAPIEKESVRKFVLRMSQPFLLDTAGLGTIQCRHLTMKAFQTFMQRMPSLAEVDDEALVRAYLGAVSGFPVDDDEALPPPLPEEEVALLTSADVSAFAQTYLKQIVKAAEVVHPVPELAAFIRAERGRIEESFKKAAEAIRGAVDVNAVADVMKNWRALHTNVAGSVLGLRDEIKRLFGTMAPSIGDAIRTLQQDRQIQIGAALGRDQERLKDILDGQREITGLPGSELKALTDRFSTTHGGRYEPFRVETPRFDTDDYVSRIPVWEPPDDEETPVGRTAIAVEELRQVGVRMEDAMDLIVEQAGNVSGLVGQVVVQIKEEAAKSQKGAKFAMGVAVLALLASLATGLAGYMADRSEAKAGDVAGDRMVAHLAEQNRLLRAMLARESQAERPSHTPEGPPAAASPPSKTELAPDLKGTAAIKPR
ncbi:hypothetical protein [Lysobacter sp. M2-1]|uniref:hypothetical protein n=1 Tax=Lysobacter sp. M2-1 TaxID=2916839 RepID=UPI001F598DE7|nr:hypothetical protein [Lysobacter sp. M2-1]